MKNVVVRSLVICALCATVLVVARAQETPESVARAYTDASRAGDWTKAAGLMHPDALKQFREMFAPLVAAAKSEKDQQEMQSLLGVKDKAEFDKLSDVEMFSKLFSMITGLSAEFKSALNSSSFDIVDQVPEGADLTHVVFRMQLKIPAPNLPTPVEFSKLDVMTLRRWEQTWRAELKGDMKGFIQAIAAAMAAEKEPESAIPPPKPPAKKRPARRP